MYDIKTWKVSDGTTTRIIEAPYAYEAAYCFPAPLGHYCDPTAHASPVSGQGGPGVYRVTRQPGEMTRAPALDILVMVEEVAEEVTAEQPAPASTTPRPVKVTTRTPANLARLERQRDAALAAWQAAPADGGKAREYLRLADLVMRSEVEAPAYADNATTAQPARPVTLDDVSAARARAEALSDEFCTTTREDDAYLENLIDCEKAARDEHSRLVDAYRRQHTRRSGYGDPIQPEYRALA